MMNRSRKAIVALVAASSLTLGAGISGAAETTTTTTTTTTTPTKAPAKSGSSNSSSNKAGDKNSLSTDDKGNELSFIGKLKAIGEVLALIASVLGGAFTIYQTIQKFQSAMK